MSDLLTWRELRLRLQADGVGTFGAMAITEWLKASPPIPVAKQPERRGDPRLFDYVEVLRWYADRKANEKKGYTPAADTDDELDEPSSEYRKYKALREKLKYAAERGRMVDGDTVKQEFAKAFANARQRVLSIPAAVAAMIGPLTPAEIEKLLYDRLADAMSGAVDTYADNDREDESAGDSIAGDGDVSTAPAADDQPVGRRRKVSKRRNKRRARKVED